MSDKLRIILKRTKLFSHLSDREFEALFHQAKTEQYQANDVILSEGSLGQCLYIIVSGAVRVFAHDKEGREVVLARLESGDYFGDQALLTETPIRHNFSVKALTNAEVIVIRHDLFQNCLQANEDLKQLLHEQGQEQLIEKLVKQLHTEEMAQVELSSLFRKIESFPERSIIFRRGTQPKFVYYLLSGRVEVRFYDLERRVKSRNLISPGQFFGEMDVINNSERLGTAVVLLDSQILVIESEKFLQAYQKNKTLMSVIDTSIHLYQIPIMGLVTQYQSEFLGRPAMNTIIQKQDGEIIAATRLMNAEVFAISHANNPENVKKELFRKSESFYREILLFDNRLLGAISMGPWDDLEDIVKQVSEKIFITQNELENFRQSGKLNISYRAMDIRKTVLCECMQVPYQRIQDLILKGIVTLEEISKLTAAGTVCGGCRPRIIDLLGGNAWTYVNLIAIREHGDRVRSYQFRPIKGSISAYQAGQHIVIEAKIENLWVARSYTLTSVSNMDCYEITVRHEKAGLFSTWLFEHGKVGSQLRISIPQGRFIFQEEKPTPAVCFMAGIGITPTIAFIRKLVASNQKRILHVDYSVRQIDQVIFNEEFSSWIKYHSNISLQIRITSQEGRLSEKDISNLMNQYPNAEFFICGPSEYEKKVTSILEQAGITKDKIYLEQFTHASGGAFKY